MLGTDKGLVVACLCAAWCGVCRDYESAFRALKLRHPDVQFAWVDVEDCADWVDDLDVENFPTLMLSLDGEPLFYGPVLPNVHVVERLLTDARQMSPLRDQTIKMALRPLLQGLSGHTF